MALWYKCLSYQLYCKDNQHFNILTVDCKLFEPSKITVGYLLVYHEFPVDRCWGNVKLALCKRNFCNRFLFVWRHVVQWWNKTALIWRTLRPPRAIAFDLASDGSNLMPLVSFSWMSFSWMSTCVQSSCHIWGPLSPCFVGTGNWLTFSNGQDQISYQGHHVMTSDMTRQLTSGSRRLISGIQEDWLPVSKVME